MLSRKRKQQIRNNRIKVAMLLIAMIGTATYPLFDNRKDVFNLLDKVNYRFNELYGIGKKLAGRAVKDERKSEEKNKAIYWDFMKKSGCEGIPCIQNLTSIYLPQLTFQTYFNLKNMVSDKNIKSQVQLINIDKKYGKNHYFKGYVIKVSNPHQLHLHIYSSNEKNSLSEGSTLKFLVDDKKAIAGINASSFYIYDLAQDKKQPIGLIISEGKLIQDYNLPKGGDIAAGITYDGKLIVGNYSSSKMLKMGVREAISSKPQLIKDGSNLFKHRDPLTWGLAPRSAIGQTEDGSVLLIYIEGWKVGYSNGASMTDLANVMEEYGAINALALGSGKTPIMMYNGKVMSHAESNEEGELLPNAWIVY